MLHSQPSGIRLLGNVRACHAVSILDRQQPVDSLQLDGLEKISDSVVYLVCMATVSDVSATKPDLGVVTNTAGLWYRCNVLSQDDRLLMVSPQSITSFDPRDRYQVVVPIVADTVIIDSIVTTFPWDGRSGGVIAIEANVLISDLGYIDVSGLGFRGGMRSNNGGSCGVVQACDPLTSDRTAGKGESIRLPIASCTNGHAPWANGGGGGDAHNAGGGGGGNGGAGGRGGNQYVCSAVPGMYGMSGMALLDGSQERIFMGGGGGGGHQNNNVATDGASGGGIVLIKAQTIIGDSLSIIASGSNAGPRAGNDGGGGGGAGGSVRIDACYAELPITIDVSGGSGSMCDGGHGPGGGGAGGRVMLQPALLQNSASYLAFDVSGGIAGTVSPSNTNGAEDGAPGIVRALCRQTFTHRLQIASKANVGDTLQIELVSTDTGSTCEVLVTHRIRYVGAAHVPLTDQLTWFDDLNVQIDRTEPDTTSITLAIPSKRSWSLPILAVLSNDSTTTVSHSSWLTSLAPAQECTWSRLSQEITVDACALRIRPIDQAGPFSVHVRQTPTHIIVDVDGALFACATCTLLANSGETIATSSTQATAYFPIEQLSQGAYAIVVDYLGARYVTPVCVYR